MAEKVLDEVKHNLKAKYKESDLFRVYQSMDLANLKTDDEKEAEELHSTIPSIMKLRKSLYSKEWREYIENISNLPKGTLTDQVDCAINCHAKGCHLLCHDDVIGTRKMSYILYFTDPTPEWVDEDGGRLELYESFEEKGIEGNGKSHSKVPGTNPVKTILPQFNSMAYFVVEPGVSFHSVQEVFCDRPRLSIQGWYHAKELPKNMEHASLSQLKENVATESKGFEGDFTPMCCEKSEDNGKKSDAEQDGDEKFKLSKDDFNFLSKYINPTYLRPENIIDICERFEEDSSVQLRHFFIIDIEKNISKLLQKEDLDCTIGRDKPSLDYKIGESSDWVSRGPAHKQRFLEYVGNPATTVGGKNDTCGAILKHLKDHVLQSEAFGRLLKAYTSLGMPLGYRGRVRRFRPGLDYTIAHYGILTRQSVLDVTVCFVAGNGEQSVMGMKEEITEDEEHDITWQSDDKGGFECYIAADDDDEEDEEIEGEKTKEADDEYNEDDDTKLLSVSACNNTLSLVYRDPGTMRFVKYVGIGAPSSRFDISLEYEVEDDEDEDEHNGNEEDDASQDIGF